jgi:hypothetical protein
MKTTARSPSPAAATGPARTGARAEGLAAAAAPVSWAAGAGNQALQRLMRAPAPAAPAPQRGRGPQADPLEREAVQAAQRVAAGQPAGALSATPSALRQAATGAALPLAALPAGARQALGGAGQPLEAPVRRTMERHFGTDFSGVRLHTGPGAAAAAASVRAHAYTCGPHIVLGGGAGAAHAGPGFRLLAHELAHVVQQRAASEPLVQREFALEQPDPDAVPAELTPEQLEEALRFNRLLFTQATEIADLRDMLGVAEEPATIDEDFVGAVARFQAGQQLTADGKLGPTTASRLSAEYRAEAAFLGRTEGRALRTQSRRMDMRSFTITVTQRARELTNTGSAEYAVRWGVPDPQANGWIIQHVTFAANKEDGAGTVQAPNNGALEYWEAWQVRRGHVFVGGGANPHRADTFRSIDEGAGTRGTVTITGRVTYMPSFNLQEPPWGHTVPEAGDLPTMTVAPAGWSDGLARLHRMRVTWDDTVAPATHRVVATP